MIEAFWIEHAGHFDRELRVDAPCGHTTTVVYEQGQGDAQTARASGVDWDAAPWPSACATCGAQIDYDADEAWQVISTRSYYRRADTGEEHSLHDWPPGAMYDAPWMPEDYRGKDGRIIYCVLPDGHHWCIDGKASNCDLPGTPHHCWCRHGEPPNLTVNHTPEPGEVTCSQGAGSIDTGSWHGFLTNGKLHLVNENVQ